DAGSADCAAEHGVGERLETHSSRESERAEPRAIDTPAVAEPAEEWAGDENADDQDGLADEQAPHRAQIQLGTFNWAEGHQPVAAERRKRAQSTESDRSRWRRLRPAGEKRDEQPGG